MAYYGRDEADWELLTSEGLAYLEQVAAHRGDATYDTLNNELVRRTGLRSFDFNLDSERAAIGKLLEGISESSYAKTGVLVSALVHHLDSNDPGPRWRVLPAGRAQGSDPPRAVKGRQIRVVGSIRGDSA